MCTQLCFAAISPQLPSAAGTGCTAPEREAALHHESPGGRKTTATPEKLHTSSVFNRTQDRYPLGHGPWSYFLVVWSASRNTGLPGKKLHLRILLGMRIGFKRNNHHKCLISQIQLILLADFLFASCTSWADSPQQGGTSLVFVSKVHLQGSTGGLALAKTAEHPWKTCPMETACSYSSGPLSKARATQPGSAQHGNNLCHEISSNSEHIAVQPGDREELCASLNSSEKREPKPELSQMVPFSATHDKQIF